MAIKHYSEERLSLVLTQYRIKMLGPHGIITVSGNTERFLRPEEDAAALTATNRRPHQPEKMAGRQDHGHG